MGGPPRRGKRGRMKRFNLHGKDVMVLTGRAADARTFWTCCVDTNSPFCRSLGKKSSFETRSSLSAKQLRTYGHPASQADAPKEDSDISSQGQAVTSDCCVSSKTISSLHGRGIRGEVSCCLFINALPILSVSEQRFITCSF